MNYKYTLLILSILFTIVLGVALFRDAPGESANDAYILNEPNLARELGVEIDETLGAMAREISEIAANADVEDLDASDGVLTLKFAKARALSGGRVYYDVRDFISSSNLKLLDYRRGGWTGIGIVYFFKDSNAKPVSWVTVIMNPTSILLRAVK